MPKEKQSRNWSFLVPRNDGRRWSRFPDGEPPEPPEPEPDPPSWNLPATINVAQDGTLGLRQYVTNDPTSEWTISVSGLPVGVTYNAGTESLEGASAGTASATAEFRLQKSGEQDVVATATVNLYEQGTSPEASIFTDTFESGDLSHSQNGFFYHSQDSNGVAVVNDSGMVVSGSIAPHGPYPEHQYANGPGIAGNHALAFRFAAGASSREKRFTIGGVYPELWVSYWMRVPVNYVHGTIGPGPRYRNQKHLAMWTDGYSGTGQPLVVCNMWDDLNSWSPDGLVGTPNKSGMSYSTVSISNATNMNSGHRSRYDNFIRFPEDRGRWMHCVHRYKVASVYGAEDGVHEWYRKWEGEQDYAVLDNRQNLGLGILEGRPYGFRHGYLMGWANGAYEEDTHFLWDDLRFSTTDLRY